MNDRETYLKKHRALMLAEASQGPALDVIESVPNAVFDLKWDGVRCLAYCERGEVWLQNRNGRDITYRYPEIVEALSVLTRGYDRVVLDGEVVAFDSAGKPSFNLVATRDRVGSADAARKAMQKVAVTYVAFDMIDLNGDSLEDAPFTTRRTLLEVHFAGSRSAGLIVSPTSKDGRAMWRMVESLELEGMIAKLPEGRWRPGRSGAWVKIKDNKRGTFIVLGYQPGTGAKQGMVGALTLGLLDGGALVEVGKAGTGLTDSDRRNLQSFFDDLGDDYEPMNPKVALRAEVEFLNFTDDGRLRFPSFKGLRMDVPLSDCTPEKQLP